MSSNLWFALWKRSTKFATKLLLVTSLFSSSLFAADSNLWEEAKTLFRAGQFAEAREKFQQWGAANPAHLESSAYWSNLAACDWKMENDARTAHGLLSSLRVGGWPSDSWGSLDALRQVESKAGIKQGVTQQPALMALLLTGKRIQIWLIMLGFWIALLSIATLGLPSLPRKHLRIVRYAGVVTGLALTLAGSATYAAHRFYIQFGVVNPAVETAQVFRDALLKNNEADLRLPSGTVVAIRESTENAIHILEPMEGWLARTDIALAGAPLTHQETRVSVRLR